jgi:hypothetical protein
MSQSFDLRVKRANKEQEQVTEVKTIEINSGGKTFMVRLEPSESGCVLSVSVFGVGGHPEVTVNRDGVVLVK